MATYSWVNIGSSNDLLHDGTKPLPEPMLTYQYQNQRMSERSDKANINHDFPKWPPDKDLGSMRNGLPK